MAIHGDQAAAAARPLLTEHDKAEQDAHSPKLMQVKPTNRHEQQPEVTEKQQGLPKLVSAELPFSSDFDLAQLNDCRATWHKHRHTHWLWLYTSMIAVYASFFTIYHAALGLCQASWASTLHYGDYTGFVQQTLGYVTAAYSVMLGMTVIVFELVCFDGAVKCELLDMSKTGRSMQIAVGAGFIAHAAISFAAARNANDVEMVMMQQDAAESV